MKELCRRAVLTDRQIGPPIAIEIADGQAARIAVNEDA
jgi:hypothetical protein